MDFSILKDRRIELNIQQKEIADYIGVSPTTVSRWEKGDIKSIKDTYITKLATILKLPADAFYGWNSSHDDEEPRNIDTDNTLRLLIIAYLKSNPDFLSDIRKLFDMT